MKRSPPRYVRCWRLLSFTHRRPLLSFGVKFKPWSLEWGGYHAPHSFYCWINLFGLPLLQWTASDLVGFINSFATINRISTFTLQPTTSITLKFACVSHDFIPSQFHVSFVNFEFLIVVRVLETNYNRQGTCSPLGRTNRRHITHINCALLVNQLPTAKLLSPSHSHIVTVITIKSSKNFRRSQLVALPVFLSIIALELR